MKLNFRKITFIILVSCFIMLCMPEKSFAGYQTLHSLDFQIDIKENGDMHITEFWNVDIEDTNTLFKTFPIDEGSDGITNVTVSEIKENEEVKFKKSNEYNYHVEEDYYQALKNPDGDFEIAWGVNSYNDIGRKFKISYTVSNHVFVYNDCSEVYWKLIGNDFEIFCEEVTGTISLPEGISNIEDLRVWAHGPLNGTITKENAETVNFRVDDLPTETFLEIRLAMPAALFELSDKTINSNKLSIILEEEARFAEEANLRRIEYARRQELYKKIATVVLSVCIVIGAVTLLINIKKLFMEKKLKPETDWKYFRDIPDENATPAEASYIYYKSETALYNCFGKIFSATLLNLSLNGWLTFGKKVDKKEYVTITLNKEGKEALREDEQEIYEYLNSLFETGVTFTTKEFEKKAQKDVKKFGKLGEKIVKYSKKVNEENGIYNQKMHNKSGVYIVELSLYMIAIVFSFIAIDYNVNLMTIFILLALANIGFSIPLMCRYNGFTQKGINEAAKWSGLEKFMKDFSLIDEREVPELALWEKYLVYATAFGVANKVIKQLKVYFPEMADEEYLSSHYTYMHFVSDSNMNFIGSLDSSMGSVVNYASAAGAGGGFSSGGGGGFGGGGGGGR